MSGEGQLWEGFSENVGSHFAGDTVSKDHLSSVNMLTNEVVLYVYVFCSWVVFGVLG